MQLIDVHSHLEWPDFKDKLDDVINRAKEAGIIAIVSSSVTTDSVKDVLKIAEKYPNYVIPCLGYSPSEVNNEPDTFDEFVSLVKKNSTKFRALGEIGLDYYHVRTKEGRQKCEDRFLELLGLAESLKKPIIIHCRDAEKRTIQLIEEHFSGDNVHMHCFSGHEKYIKKGLKNGWLFSVPTSVVNRRNHKILAETVPIDRMMLETDAPFLSPLENEKMNESKNILISAKYIAELKGISIEELAEATTNNAKEFYSINNIH